MLISYLMTNTPKEINHLVGTCTCASHRGIRVEKYLRLEQINYYPHNKHTNKSYAQNE